MGTQYPDFDGTQACNDVDVEIFFPEETSPASKAAAVNICNTCNSVEKCLDYALHHDVQGIWAGTNEYERKKIRRKLGIKNIDYMYLTIDRLTKFN